MDELSKLEKKILEQFKELPEEEQKVVLKQMGHKKLAPKSYDFKLPKDKRYRIALVSDSHYGNKNHNYKFEAKLFRYFKRAKPDIVIDAGDLLDGHNMHYGQFWEQNHTTFMGQKEDFLANRPDIGVTQYFVSGNHMYNGFDKKIGFNSGKNIASSRDDLKWLADIEADIVIGKDFRIKVMHPSDGTAYALSYKPQKKIEAMGKDAPDMLILGHYHKAAYFNFRGTHC